MLTKSKFTGAALATLALVGCLVATSGNAQAHPRFGVGLGIGIAAGAVIGAAVASGPMRARSTAAATSSATTAGAIFA